MTYYLVRNAISSYNNWYVCLEAKTYSIALFIDNLNKQSVVSLLDVELNNKITTYMFSIANGIRKIPPSYNLF